MLATNLPPDVSLLNDPVGRDVKQLPASPRSAEKEGIKRNIKELATPVLHTEEVLTNVSLAEKTDEELEDMLPYHEQPLRIPIPFFPLTDYPRDEFRNNGSIYIEMLKNRASSYYQSKRFVFESILEEDPSPLPPVSECIAVMFQTAAGQIVIDEETRKTFPELDVYEDLCSIVDESYEPIYIFTKTTGYKISAEEFVKTYKSMFPLRSVEEEEKLSY